MRSTKNNKNFCSSSLCTCLHHMVIIRSQNKITDFFMILAWASPFNKSIFTNTKQRNFSRALIKRIAKFKMVSLVCKAVTGNAPQYIQTMFTNIKDHSKYSLRPLTNKKKFVTITNHKILFPYRSNNLECIARKFENPRNMY